MWMFQLRVDELVQVKLRVLHSSLASSIMWYPVFVPQIMGGVGPSELAVNWAFWHWVLPFGGVLVTVAVFGWLMSNVSNPSRNRQISLLLLHTENKHGELSLVELLK